MDLCGFGRHKFHKSTMLRVNIELMEGDGVGGKNPQ